MKSIWSGSISFGLVSIPVKLQSAVKEHAIGFKMLCAQCHTPISYQRWCSSCNKPVAWQEIVKGIEITKGRYFVLTPQNLKSLKPHKTDSIQVIEFVPLQSIPSIAFKNHFYVLPEKKDQKTFFLFKDAISKNSTCAIGQFVLRDKEYLCALQSYQTIILLSLLHYGYEVRPVPEVDVLPAPNKQELSLALQLIDKLSKPSFDSAPFKDTFVQRLIAYIKQKQKGKTVKLPEPPKSEKKQPSLIGQLQASLEQ